MRGDIETSTITKIEKEKNWKNVCHKFHNKWQLQFAAAEQNKRALEVENIKRHFQQIHSEFYKKFFNQFSKKKKH